MDYHSLRLNEVELPSNKRFGYLFSLIFLISSTYFLWIDNHLLAISFLITSLTFLLITLLKPDLLYPLNKLWMRFGLLLGMIISPIILGLLFFGLFTPTSIVMRLFKRDELQIRFSQKESYWNHKEEATYSSDMFKNQF